MRELRDFIPSILAMTSQLQVSSVPSENVLEGLDRGWINYHTQFHFNPVVNSYGSSTLLIAQVSVH
jgi:hypothetical protein